MNKKIQHDVTYRRTGNIAGKDSDEERKKRLKMKILKDLNERGDDQEEEKELPRDFFDIEENYQVKEDNQGNEGNNNNTNNDNNSENSSSSNSSISYKLNDEYEDEANIMIEYSTRVANIISTYTHKQQQQQQHHHPLQTSSNTHNDKFLSIKRTSPSPSPVSKEELLSQILN